MKRLLKISLAAAALLLFLAVTSVWILQTEWFREKLRGRLVTELETVTGGRVEVGPLRFDPIRWRGQAEGIVVHGLEEPSQRPLFRVRAVELELKVLSFVRRSVDIVRLRFIEPEVHIQLRADGSTNIPQPRLRTGRLFTDRLIDLAVDDFIAERGTLWWNDRRFPLEIASQDLRLQLAWDPSQRYNGRLTTGRITVTSGLRLPPIESFSTRLALFRDRVQFEEMRLKTPASEATASGVITNLRQPRWDFRYEASVNAREAAAMLSSPQLQAGESHVQGQVSYDSARSAWSTAGILDARRLAIADPAFRARDVAVSARYKLDALQLHAEDVRLRLLGGEWNGRVAIDYTNRRAPFLSAQGRVSGIHLAELTRALATPSRPLDRLAWDATVDGKFDAQATLPLAVDRAAFDADVALKPPDKVTAGSMPVQGVFRGAFRGPQAEWQLEELRLLTARSSLSASGRLHRKAGPSLQFHLETSQPEEFTAAAAAFTGTSVDLPGHLDGRAVAKGTLSGTIERPQVNAALEVSQFAYEGRQWDSLRGRLEWSLNRLRLAGARLTRGNTTINLDLAAGLENGRLTTGSSLQAEASVRDVAAEDLLSLAGQKFPLRGAVTGRFTLEGTRERPRGSGSVEIRRGSAWEEPFDSLRASLALESDRLRVSNLNIAVPGGAIAGAGDLNLEQQSFRFDLRTERLALAGQQWLAREGHKIGGDASFEVAVSGRRVGDDLRGLSLDGNLQLRGLAVDGRTLGDLRATVRPAANKLRVELQSNFLGAAASGQAEIVPDDPFPAEGRIEFRNLDVVPALSLAGITESRVRGSVDGSATFTVEARRPETLSAKGSLTRLELSLPENVVAGRIPSISSASPLNWQVAKGRLTFGPARFVGEGSDLQGSGSLDLAPDGALDLAWKGNLDLALLGGFAQNLETKGSATVDVQVKGTRSQPDIDGRAEIREGSITSQDLLVSLTNANGIVTFSRGRATIQKLTAEAGGGTITVSGDADFSNRPLPYRLRAQFDRVRLRYPRGFTFVVNGSLNLTGSEKDSVLGGELRMIRAATRPGVDLAYILDALREPPRTPTSSPWLQRLQLNATLVSDPDIRFETSLARNLQLDISMRLSGTALNPSLLGRVNITDGEIEFQGTRYIINRGDITFANPFRIDPNLNLNLETRVSGYDIALTLAGPLQRPNISYRSDPPLPFNELITLLAVGRAPVTDPTLAAQQTAQARSLSQLGASSVIGQALTRPVTGRLERFFGVSRLKVDPEIAGPEGNPNARFIIDQPIGNDITFTYVYSLASAQEQVVRVQWAINKQWSLIAVRDENGTFGIDVLFKKRYK